jgi:hypothetical protein
LCWEMKNYIDLDLHPVAVGLFLHPKNFLIVFSYELSIMIKTALRVVAYEKIYYQAEDKDCE